MSKKLCSDCDSAVDRRRFLQAASSAAAIVAASRFAFANPSSTSGAESAAAKLYESLSEKQRETVCFGFDHQLRSRISANWQITKPTVGSDFYTKDQQALIDTIVRKVTSEDGYERLKKQTEYDAGGMDQYSIALFGQPGSGKFEWVMTGRHLTLRADGDSVEKTAFGGPIIYGHGEETATENLFYYQTKQANEVFKALDAKQAERALIAKAPAESAVSIQGTEGKFPGIGVGELSSDQKQLVEQTLKVLLAPYRQEDVEEVMSLLKATGGVDQLHMAFYQQEDLQNDKVWDIWRVEGPAFVWHFRGAPHVHAYINIAQKA
jgi:hypothetical protein